MSETMMKLGDYVFSIQTAAYDRLVREASFNWVSQPRAGRIPAVQFTGAGDETITLSGLIYPGFNAGADQIQNMRAQGAKGEPLSMVDGNGYNWGRWAITKVREGQSYIDDRGAPRKQAFTISLIAYGEDAQ